MARRRPYRAIRQIDPKALAAFQAGIRKRYTDEEILGQLRASAERLGRSPTMREFADDEAANVHPQTVIERFGSWNRAKRTAGLVPRRFATKEELLQCLRELGETLGRVPTAKDVDAHRRSCTVEIALLAHVRLADERAPRGRIRRPGRGGAARAGRRARSRVRPSDSAVCRSSPTGPRRGAGSPGCSPSGRCIACLTRGAAPGRHSSFSFERGWSDGAWTSPRTDRCASA